MRRLAIWSIVLSAVLLAYAATGLLVVAPGEVAVVRRFGRVLETVRPPGLHLGWPLGIDRAIRVRTDEVRQVAVGLAGTPGPDDEPGAGEFLTGDFNLVRTHAVVQYRVADPSAYVLHTADVVPLLTRMTEAGVSRALSKRAIDAALGEGRVAIAREVEGELTCRIAAEGLGVAILGVSLTDTRPPSEVAGDFAAAQSAQSEKHRRIQEGKAYASRILPSAKAESFARIERARAVAERRVVLARSGARGFLALLNEARRARPLTVRRLYLDRLRELLPKVRRKVLLSPDDTVDLSILGEAAGK